MISLLGYELFTLSSGNLGADSTGFGDYTETGQVIPVRFKGQEGGYTHAMFVNDGPPIYGGRELWGFPKKYAQPSLGVERDTLIGTLNYGSVRVATGTMGFKHKALDQNAVRAGAALPVREIVSATHIIADLTLGLGKVVYDYL